jgi:phosphoserine phosphatase
MRNLVAVDLDQTLIYSKRSICRAGGTTQGLVCVEMSNDAEMSFMTSPAMVGLKELDRTAVLVAATTRTREQYQRIDLGGIRPAFAVVANGAELLVNGAPDSDWAARTSALLALNALDVHAVAGHLRDVLDPAWTKRIAVAQEVFAVAVIQRCDVPETVMEHLTTWATELGLNVSVQGRKLYVVPAWLDKKAAVEEVRRRTGTTRLLCAGDSLLDASLLTSAHAAIRPAHGELHERGWTSGSVSITDASGVLAGEEIVDWLLRECVPSQARPECDLYCSAARAGAGATSGGEAKHVAADGLG